MESLEVFDISGCSKVKKIPEFVGEMKNFSRLSFGRTVVQEIPSSVIRRSLERIDLSGIALGETESCLVSVKNFRLSNFLGCNAPLARSLRSFFTFGEFPTKISQPVSLVLASLKDLCFLKDLNLENCNLCEGAIPEDIGFLSCLERLNLSGNLFVSLPASISGLSKLKDFELRNCKRLQQLPAIPLNSDLSMNMENCASLKMLPYLQHACRVRRFRLNSVNCFSLAGNEGCNAMMYSALEGILQELPHFVEYFSILIPGSEIPEWFNSQSMGDSVIEKLPSHSCNSKWMGFALCALLEAAQNISAPTREGWFNRHHIVCFPVFGSNNTFSDCRGAHEISLSEMASDHLCLVFLSRKFLLREGRQPETNRWDQIQFHFETECAVGSKTWLKVKKCGVRLLYEQDTEEELNRTMKQYSNRSISLCEDVTNCDFEE